jgi:hypothetical protein
LDCSATAARLQVTRRVRIQAVRIPKIFVKDAVITAKIKAKLAAEKPDRGQEKQLKQSI